MKNKHLLAALVGILLLSSAISVSADWTPPSLPFPQGSPNAPLDESNLGQIKPAALDLGALTLYNSSDLNPFVLGVGQKIKSFLNGAYTGVNFELSDSLVTKTTLFNTVGIFDINTLGIILPRPAAAPTSPTAGTIYYKSGDKSVQLYDGSVWKAIGAGAASQWADIAGFGVEYVGGKARINPASGNPELQLKYGAGTNDHWGVYNDKTSGELRIWNKDGNDIVSITPQKSNINQQGPLNLLDINSANAAIITPAKFTVNGQLCLTGVCKSVWPAVGGTSLSGGQANYLPIWASPTEIGVSSIFQGTTGKVGIGTNIPSAKLQVEGPIGAKSLGDETFLYGLDANNKQRFAINLDNTAPTIPTFYDQQDASGWKPSISLNKGNVGIGTTNPQSPLTVYKAGAGASKLSVQSDSTTNDYGGGIYFPTDGVNNTDVAYIRQKELTTDSYGLIFATRAVDLGQSLTEKMVILGNGNVGIGTTAPAAKLSVGGTGSAGDGIAVYSNSAKSAVYAEQENGSGYAIYGSGKIGVRGNIILLRESGTSVLPGSGPSVVFESPSSDISVSAITAPVQCTKSGNTCSGKTDNTGTTLEAPKLNCSDLTVGQEYTDIYAFQQTGGAVTYQYQTIACKAGTSQYSIRTNNGVLEFLNSGNESKFTIDQDGKLTVGSISSADLSASNMNMSGNLTVNNHLVNEVLLNKPIMLYSTPSGRTVYDVGKFSNSHDWFEMKLNGQSSPKNLYSIDQKTIDDLKSGKIGDLKLSFATLFKVCMTQTPLTTCNIGTGHAQFKVELWPPNSSNGIQLGQTTGYINNFRWTYNESIKQIVIDNGPGVYAIKAFEQTNDGDSFSAIALWDTGDHDGLSDKYYYVQFPF